MIIKSLIIDFISSFAYVSTAGAYKLRIIMEINFFMHNFSRCFDRFRMEMFFFRLIRLRRST